MRALDLSEGGVAQARRHTREAVASLLTEIDALAGELLGLSHLEPSTITPASDDAEEDEAAVE